MTLLSGWGKYPTLDAEQIFPATAEAVVEHISQGEKGRVNMIARGLGRSYGDSSLAERVLSMGRLDHFLGFDEASGRLRCSAGISLADILALCVPKGWFLPVTPGTKFVTVGGAIASDVHGKNHHREGCFSQHVTSMKLATVTHGIIECSATLNTDLFLASCGGMGLTGVIVEATLQLKRIQSSQIRETTHKAENLDEVFGFFEEYREASYSVAWIDCLSTGAALGRSLLMLGEHAEDGGLDAHSTKALTVPLDMPGFLVSRSVIKAFNELYYHRVRKKVSQRVIHYDSFFYPLDNIHHWNRMYGKRGFTQYQFVLPEAAGLEGIKSVLASIAASRYGSFLSVLKKMGHANNNVLSFPMAGYTLALDFKMDDGLPAFLDELDRIVLDYGGRIYLTKDARMSKAVFRQSYPQWEGFRAVRAQYGADGIFNSTQSLRLGL